MAKLQFDLDGVVSLCEHARDAGAHTMGYEGDLDEGPALLLVGDDGVYLMSNGQPGMRRDDGNHVVVYARGINPKHDDDWWERKRATFGGDDGAETLPCVDTILKLREKSPDARTLEIELTFHNIKMRVKE